MAKFVQIIEYSTKKRDEFDKLMDEWMAATEGKRTATRALSTADRDQANTYVDIVEFPSYEAAMKTNDLPATSSLAEQFAKLCDSGPRFRNLDVTREDSL